MSDSPGGALWPGGAAWIDGEYCPVEEAKISVLDLGVTRSDSTYDVVHVWRGRFYRLGDHLDRFAASLTRLRLDPGHDRAALEPILRGCVARTGLREAYVSMTCTRGRPPAGPLLGQPRGLPLRHPGPLRGSALALTHISW
jgi:branched-chain amino acid aminotransferase